MADYKRYISYVYIYKNGEKDHNIGFVKLEARAGNVKLALNIKCKELMKSAIKLYMFYRTMEGEEIISDMNLIPIENVYSDSDEYSRTYRTSMDNVFGSGIDIERIAGVVMLLDGCDCIGTEWDDRGIDTNILNGEEKAQEAEIKEEMEFQEVLYRTSKTVSESVNDPVEETNIDNMKEIKDNVDDNSDCDGKYNNIEKSDILNFSKFNESQVIYGDIQSDNRQQMSSVQRIFSSFPGMYPFEDDEIMECVKLEPRDIGVFSMDKWPLAQNSFLLHGYYTYRHLIFARMRYKGIYKYILGVPGIFRDRERFMASMFGFRSFKGVQNKSLTGGEFGYWYLELKM